MNDIIVIVSFLTRVLREEMTPEEALKLWPENSNEEDELISSAWHDLSHYACDDDIRKADREYDVYQRNLLTDKIKKIQKKYKISDVK